MNRFLSGAAAIVGVYESPTRKAPGVHPYALHAEAIRGALSDAGLELGDVDGFCTAASMPPEGAKDMDLGEIAEYVGLQPRWFDSTDIGGAAFVTHAWHAAAAIAAGLCEVVVVSYAASGRSWPLPYDDFATLPYGPGQFEMPQGPTTVASYALAATRHMHQYGTTAEQLAKVAVVCRENAAANPDALYRDPISVEDVLASPMIADPLHRLDSCVVTDSGVSFVRQRVRDPVGIDRVVVEALGLQEDLMPGTAGEPHHLVLDGGAVARADAADLAGIHRRAGEIGADDGVGRLGGGGYPAANLCVLDTLGKE